MFKAEITTSTQLGYEVKSLYVPGPVKYRNGQRVIWTSNAPDPASQYVNQPGRITGIQADATGRAMDLYYVTLDSHIHVTTSAAQLQPEPEAKRNEPQPIPGTTDTYTPYDATKVLAAFLGYCTPDHPFAIQQAQELLKTARRVGIAREVNGTSDTRVTVRPAGLGFFVLSYTTLR